MKKNKQQQEMEKQLQSFAGSTAGSVVIALGAAVVGLPFAIKYLVKAAEEQALPYAAMLGSSIGDRVAAHGKATREALEKKKADEWHEANPDVTTADIDVPARSGDPYTDYLKKVGLPLSTVLILFGDKEGLSAYQHAGDWNFYGTRKINGQHYYIVVPKGINVYVKIDKTIYETPDEHGLCRVGFKIVRFDGIAKCEKTIKESILVTPSVWP